MFEKMEQLVKKFIAFPLVIGVIGYMLIGMSFVESIYAAATLYFVNPVNDINTPLILLAKITALLVAAGVVLNFLRNVFLRLDHYLCRRHADATIVYSDNEWGDIMVRGLKHGYLGSDDGEKKGRLDVVAHYILLFSDDIKTLKFLKTHEAELEGKNVYVLLNQVDSGLIASIQSIDIHYFNTYELLARDYWKKNHLFELRKEPKLRIAIIGYERVGRSVFRYGYLNNIYSLSQQIEYHIWGCSASERQFLGQLPFKITEDKDRVLCHEDKWQDELDLLAQMDRVIITKESEIMEILPELLYRNPTIEIHCFNEKETDLHEIFMTSNIKTFGDPSEVLTEEKIKSDLLFRMGKLFNYDYCLRYDQKNAGPDFEEEMERAWAKLDGFKKGSNIARADHYWIERRLELLSEQDETEFIPEEDFLRMEHIRWSRYHLINHWEYHEERNDAIHHHNLLIPYDELRNKEAKKDGIYDPLIKTEIGKLVED